jgi:endonuclease/exonuclease/phosphatase family metal-dependent hydrolase
LIRIASYNIHRGIGCDSRFSAQRILDVLNEIQADAIALQEVESHSTGIDMLAWLAERTGYYAIAGITLLRAESRYGNAVLTRFPIRATQLLDLSFSRHEPRGAIVLDLDCDGSPLLLVATHLGLRPAERRAQIEQLLAPFRARPHMRAILLGDLNEWFLWGRPLRRLHRHFQPTPAPPTFPARLPMFALDRLWAHPRSILRYLGVHSSMLARAASDHLPLVAEVEP